MDADKLIQYIDSKFTSFKEELLDELVTKEDFRKGYDKLDNIIGELQAVRQEQAAHTASHERVDETLREHDQRLTELESHQLPAHDVS
jgi:hypothetical protein